MSEPSQLAGAGEWDRWLGDRARDQVRQSLSVEVDALRLVDLQAELRDRLEATAGVRLSITDLVTRAATVAALEHPALIASDGKESRHGVDVGLVVVDAAGYPAVVVIEDAHQHSVVQLAGERQDAVPALTDAYLAQIDLFVSNLGPYGVDHFVPGAAPTPAPVVGVGRIRQRGAASMWLSLSVDARYVSLVTAAKALDRMRALLEHPTLLIV